MALLSVYQKGPAVRNAERAAVCHGELASGFCVVKNAAEVKSGAGELKIGEVHLTS